MPKVKLNLRELSVPEKIARAQQIVTAMIGNANFPAPQPPLDTINTVITELDSAFADAQAARQEAKARTSIVNEKSEIFDRVLSQLAAYVESVSGEDVAKIQSAGMEVRSPRTPSGTLPPPEGLSASQGDREGQIDLQWNKVERARSYIIEHSADPPTPTSWTRDNLSTRARATVKGLTIGTKYWFRVAAHGTQGQSGWSNPAVRIAP